MTETAVAAFAQIIPVLFIAAFLSNVKIGGSVISKGFAIAFISSGAIAEMICVLSLALDWAPGAIPTAVIVMASVYMLSAVIATAWQKLQDDEVLEAQNCCQPHDHGQRNV